MIFKLSLLVAAMFFLGYTLGHIEERVKNESVSKKLDISKYLNNSNTSIQMERRAHDKRGNPLVPDDLSRSIRDSDH